MKRFDNYKPKLIALSIDSAQGSIVQAEIIAAALSSKAKQLDCPFYTFAESVALGSGYLLLSAGDKVHTDPHSLIGGISSSFQGIGLVKALKLLKIRPTIISNIETRVNPFQEVKAADNVWIGKLLEYQDGVLKEAIEKYRKQVSVWHK